MAFTQNLRTDVNAQQFYKVLKGCLKVGFIFSIKHIAFSIHQPSINFTNPPPLAYLVRMKTLQRRGAVSHEFAASSRSNMEAGFCHLGWHPASMHGIGPSNWARTAKWNHNAQGQRAREESTQLPLRTSDAGELYKCRSNCGPRSWPTSLWHEGLSICTSRYQYQIFEWQTCPKLNHGWWWTTCPPSHSL